MEFGLESKRPSIRNSIFYFACNIYRKQCINLYNIWLATSRPRLANKGEDEDDPWLSTWCVCWRYYFWMPQQLACGLVVAVLFRTYIVSTSI